MPRWILWTGAGVAALLLIASVYFGPRIMHLSDIGAGYLAKQMCSCIYVGGRDFDACRQDMPEDMDRISAELLTDAQGVRAGILGIERRALHHPGTGCTLR